MVRITLFCCKNSCSGHFLTRPCFSRMFNACRIPTKPADYAVKIREDDPAGAHFVVIRNNKYYKVPLWAETGGKWSTEALQQSIATFLSV